MSSAHTCACASEMRNCRLAVRRVAGEGGVAPFQAGGRRRRKQRLYCLVCAQQSVADEQRARGSLRRGGSNCARFARGDGQSGLLRRSSFGPADSRRRRGARIRPLLRRHRQANCRQVCVPSSLLFLWGGGALRKQASLSFSSPALQQCLGRRESAGPRRREDYSERFEAETEHSLARTVCIRFSTLRRSYSLPIRCV